MAHMYSELDEPCCCVVLRTEYLPKMLMLIHVPHALASVVGSHGL